MFIVGIADPLVVFEVVSIIDDELKFKAPLRTHFYEMD